MAKTRAELQQYAQRTYDEVDGVRLQSLTELELSELRTRWGLRYSKTKQIDMVMRRELLVAAIVDDDGDRLFADDEIDELAAWNGAVTERLYKAARSLIGMDEEDESDLDDVEGLEKKSEPTTASA